MYEAGLLMDVGELENQELSESEKKHQDIKDKFV